MSSVEALAIASVVEEGASGLRQLYAKGISSDDFELYDEEIKWIEKRLGSRKVLNRRVFKQRFPSFEYIVPNEDLADIASELKEERAFLDMNTLLETISDKLERGNAIELATVAREELSRLTRLHSPHNDIDLDDWKHTITEMRQGMLLAKNGQMLGLPTGFEWLDEQWGGLMPGNLIAVLGRTGEGKSYVTTMFGWSARKAGAKVGIFTPEMSEHEVKCRYHTLASADKSVQDAVGLKTSFKNRNLYLRYGFNLKKYQALCEHLNTMPGRIHLLSGTHRAGGMTVGYIDDRIQELGLDLVIIDPIYLLKPVRRYRDNPYLEVGNTAEAIENLCETHNIPIVITNQAHRQGANGDAPHKDKSFGSDIPVQLADYVLGVKNLSDEHRLICRCTKARHGEEFRFDCRFIPNTGRLETITPLTGRLTPQNQETEEEMQDMVAK